MAKHKLALKSFCLERHVTRFHISLAKVSCMAKTGAGALVTNTIIYHSLDPSVHHISNSLCHLHVESVHLSANNPKSHPFTVQVQSPRFLDATEISLLIENGKLVHFNSEIYEPIKPATSHP